MVAPESYDSHELEEEYTDEGSDSEVDDEEEATPRGTKSEMDHLQEQEIPMDPEPPEEGIYGMGVASIIIDYRNLILANHADDQESGCERQLRYGCRFVLAMLLTLSTIFLQLYLTAMTKMIVTPDSVRELREAYGQYEVVMYDNHTQLTPFGHHRGIEGFYNVSLYTNLGKDEMHEICDCALAQPLFLSAILLVWTVTCLAYMRQTVGFTIRLLMLGTTPSMKDRGVLKAELHKGKPTGKHEVVAVTICIKVVMVCVVQLPVLAMNVFLLWIGCRWLVATLGFGTILLNAVALEFVLNLHEIFYRAIVPYTMKISLASIMIPQGAKASEKPSWWNMFSAFGLLILAVLWTGLYIKIQRVLPGYNWDIAPACTLFMAQANFEIMEI